MGHLVCSHHVFLDFFFFLSETVCYTSIALDVLDSFELLWSGVLVAGPSLGKVDLFHRVKVVLRDQEKDQSSKVPFSEFSIRGTHYQLESQLPTLSLDPWLRQCLLALCFTLLSLKFLEATFWKEVPIEIQYLREFL